MPPSEVLSSQARQASALGTHQIGRGHHGLLPSIVFASASTRREFNSHLVEEQAGALDNLFVRRLIILIPSTYRDGPSLAGTRLQRSSQNGICLLLFSPPVHSAASSRNGDRRRPHTFGRLLPPYLAQVVMREPESLARATVSKWACVQPWYKTASR